MSRFPVVTICGSMRFYLEMIRVAERYTAQGHIVLMPFVTVHDQSNTTLSDRKLMLDEMHLQKIDMSSIVIIVTNAENYTGESTRSELSYAIMTGKTIVWERKA